ncbi:MAG TPA: polyhydroxyalkanoate depolymerase, partial [Usitatibacteraceae bacterium]|nr:polyhydroxyalkanoate depolymerase [Usitatibacteraceae bacterium]
MLYQFYDWQREAMEPWRRLAQAANEFYGHPVSPFAYLPGSRNVAAAFDLMGRLTQRYERAEFGIGSVRVGERNCAVTEVFELDRPFCRLLHFVKQGAPAQPRVLVFAPLSGHFATLLRDTVNSLLSDHDVWITDWIDAKEVPLAEGPFHFDDYVDYVRDFIGFVGPGVHAISVCQPTVPVLAGVSLMAAAGETVPRSLTMMGGPIDTRSSPTAVNDFAKHRPISWFEAKVVQRVPMRYPGFMRRVYPGFLQFAGFVAMNPDRHFESHLQYYQHVIQGDGEGAGAHRRFYDEFNAVMDLPAEYYLDTVERVFHKHLLPRGKLQVRGERVRPELIRDSALFTIEGELDDISGPGQTKAALALCKGIPAKAKMHFRAPGVGHYG